jgi:hypothetical protein
MFLVLFLSDIPPPPRSLWSLKLEGNSKHRGALPETIKPQGIKMTAETDAEILKKLATKAADLAKDLRESADQQAVGIHLQHLTAHKLEDLSDDLAKGAVDVMKNLKSK